MTQESNNAATAAEQTPYEKGKTPWELLQKEQERLAMEKEEEFKKQKELEAARIQLVLDKYLTDFEPKQIGDADYKLYNEMERKYKVFCNLINKSRQSLATFFEIEGNFGTTETAEFIKSNPKKWLPERYIDVEKIQIPAGLNRERVIEEKLVSYPETEELVSLHKRIISAWKDIKATGFIFPFQKLYDEERDLYSTEFNLDFGEYLSNFLAVRTTTPEQNAILEIIEKLLESLHDLSHLRIIKLEKGPAEIQRIERFFKFKGGGFEINPFIFHRDPSLKQYGPVEISQNMNVSLQDFLQ